MYDAFVFKNYNFDATSGRLRLGYAFENGPSFEETITFPLPADGIDASCTPVLDHLFRLLLVFAGVSYYKTYVPQHIRCAAFPLDTQTTAFAQTVYAQGLGEFAYKNNLSLSFSIEPILGAPVPLPVSLPLHHGALIPVGGGKDSIVTIETLRDADTNITLFALGGTTGMAQPIKDTAHTSGLPIRFASRTLSPKLADLNAAGALNGHIPITAILSTIATICAVMHGLRDIVLSNEHSASAPNVITADGHSVNHQYSKSLAFERDFAAYLQRHVSPDLRYFSLLRPLSEAAITRRFARYTEYHPIFRSCNTAFRQDPTKRNQNWCCNCPKCRFVFLALAPFLKKEKLIGIFGRNLLDDQTQLNGFAELVGVSGHKPFECVGEIEESALLLTRLSKLPDWQNDIVLTTLTPQITISDFENRFAALFENHPDNDVPHAYLELLNAHH